MNAASDYTRNELRRSYATLIGLAQGMLGDGGLSGAEARFLLTWLENNPVFAHGWPGQVVHEHARSAVAPGAGVEELSRLADTLQRLVGGDPWQLTEGTHVTALALEDADVSFRGMLFCLTGEFAFGTKAVCARAIERRGGSVKGHLSADVDFLVVGGLGSAQWRDGSFGTKIRAAVELRAKGLAIAIVHEDRWADALSRHPPCA